MKLFRSWKPYLEGLLEGMPDGITGIESQKLPHETQPLLGRLEPVSLLPGGVALEKFPLQEA